MIAENEVIKIAHKDAFNQDFEFEGFDFNGKTVRCHWRKDEEQATPDLVFTSTPANGITIIIASTTQALLKFNKTTTQMSNIAVGTYHYDIEAVNGSGDVQTLCYGKINVVKKYTK